MLQKKVYLVLFSSLIFCLHSSLSIGQDINGTCWRSGSSYIGFDNNSVYEWMPTYVTYPDPPYWSDLGITLVFPIGSGNYFFTDSLLPFSITIGIVNPIKGAGIKIWNFLFPFPMVETMSLLPITSWNPSIPPPDGECDVNGFSDIVQLSAGQYYTIGLKSDGTVVAVGDNTSGQCDVGWWSDIIQVEAGWLYTLGIKPDGSVVGEGMSNSIKRELNRWSDIVQVSTGYDHTIGLKSDGTVVAVGETNCDECDVSEWNDIIQVAAKWFHIVGIKSDGTVMAVGDNTYGQCDVGEWSDIVQVVAGRFYTVGLKSDGTVVTMYEYFSDFSGWNDIVQVATTYDHMVGLKSDGTVMADGCE